MRWGRVPSIGDHEVASAVSSKHVNDSLTCVQNQFCPKQGSGELDFRLLPLSSRSNMCHHGVLLECSGTNEHDDGGTGAMFWFQTVVSQGRRAPPPTTDQVLHSTRKAYHGGHKSLTTPQMMSSSSSPFEPFPVLVLQIPTLHL